MKARQQLLAPWCRAAAAKPVSFTSAKTHRRIRVQRPAGRDRRRSRDGTADTRRRRELSAGDASLMVSFAASLTPHNTSLTAQQVAGRVQSARDAIPPLREGITAPMHLREECGARTHTRPSAPGWAPSGARRGCAPCGALFNAEPRTPASAYQRSEASSAIRLPTKCQRRSFTRPGAVEVGQEDADDLCVGG